MIADLCLDLWNIFGSALVWLAVTIGGAAAIALAWEQWNGGPEWPDIRELSEADTQEMEAYEVAATSGQRVGEDASRLHYGRDANPELDFLRNAAR